MFSQVPTNDPHILQTHHQYVVVLLVIFADSDSCRSPNALWPTFAHINIYVGVNVLIRTYRWISNYLGKIDFEGFVYDFEVDREFERWTLSRAAGDLA